MSLNFLPAEIEEIITDYKNQLEMTEKYEEVLDELEELVEREYMPNEHNNTTHWGYTVYEGRKLYGSDILLVMREDQLYDIQYIIYEDKCYYDPATIEYIMDDLIHYEGYTFPQVDIDDVDEDWIWNDMIEDGDTA